MNQEQELALVNLIKVHDANTLELRKCCGTDFERKREEERQLIFATVLSVIESGKALYELYNLSPYAEIAHEVNKKFVDLSKGQSSDSAAQ